MKTTGNVASGHDGTRGRGQLGLAFVGLVELRGGAGELVNAEFALLLADFEILQAKAFFAAVASDPADCIGHGLGGLRVTVGRKMLRVT